MQPFQDFSMYAYFLVGNREKNFFFGTGAVSYVVIKKARNCHFANNRSRVCNCNNLCLSSYLAQ